METLVIIPPRFISASSPSKHFRICPDTGSIHGCDCARSHEDAVVEGEPVLTGLLAALRTVGLRRGLGGGWRNGNDFKATSVDYDAFST
jgi:hypothetical protein